nr:MAG TPA: hypothetical protein [Caudoviricetes sp.]
MGVLEIRMLQERLGNIGGIAARAAEDRTAAARIRAQADGEKVKSLLGGLSAVQKGFEIVQDARLRTEEADRRRRKDNYLADLQNEFNSWMNGDGSAENPGKWNENPQDVGGWTREVREKYAEISDAARKRYNLSDREFETVSRSADAFRNQWFGRVSSRAAETMRRNDQAAATALVKADEITLSYGDGSPELHRQYADHINAKCDAYGVTDPEQRKLIFREAGLKLCQTGVRNYIRDTDERASAPGADGAKVWDEAVKALESGDGSSLLPPNATFRTPDGKNAENVVGRWVEGADLEALRKAALDDLREGRARWIRADEARKAEAAAAIKTEFANAEQELYKDEIPKTPEGEAAHFDRQSLGYRALADRADEAGQKDLALKYRKASESLGFKSAARADEALKAEREETFDAESIVFGQGGWIDERGEFRELSQIDLQERALDLLISKRITPAQNQALRKLADGRFDKDAQEFRSYVLDLGKRLVPNAIRYNAKRNLFEFNPTAKVREGTLMPSDGGIPALSRVKNGYEQVTYGKLVDAMNTAMRWRKVHNADETATREYFDKLVAGTVQKQLQESINERNRSENVFLDAYEELRRKTYWAGKDYTPKSYSKETK